jgi:hypothetical protein
LFTRQNREYPELARTPPWRRGVGGSWKRAQIVEMVAAMVAPLLLPKNPLTAKETKVGKAVYVIAFLPVTVIYMLPIVLIARLATIVLVIFFLLGVAALVSFQAGSGFHFGSLPIQAHHVT